MNPVLSSTLDASLTFKVEPAGLNPSKRKNLFGNILAVLTQNEKKRFGLLILLDIIISIIDILSLAVLLWLIQFYIQPAGRPLPFLPSWMLNKNSVAFITVFFFLFAIKNLAAFFIAKLQNRFVAEVAVRISKNNLSAYQNTAFKEFVRVDSSIHIRKTGFQPFDFCQHILSGIQQIITQTALIFITITAIFFFNARLFLLLLLILLPPVVGVFYFIRRQLTKSKLQIKTSNQLSFQYLMDALKGYVEGNIYHRNDFFLRRFVSQRRKFSLHLFNSLSWQTLPGRLIEVFAVMGLFILILIAHWRGSDSGALITVGAFMAAAYKIIPGIVKIVNTASQIKAYEFSLDDMVLSEKDRADEGIPPVTHIQSIKFSDVSFQYDGSPVLKDLSFSVQPGDFVGITGKSGKGKTTLFNLLLGFLSPVSGNIFINDVPVAEKDIKRFWPLISYVRQQGFFIHDTIGRNIALEEHIYDQRKLLSVIEIAGLNDLINGSPEGIQKIITENGKNISGGQQQRIALARALYKDASLVLLDEPFNELDEASELALLHYFKQLANQGKMVIMITHHKNALSFCTKIVSLDEE